jgi:hypothetical protein
MNNDRFFKLGAAGGILFVALQLAGQSLIQIGGAEPDFNAPASEILTFFMNRELDLARAGGFLSILSLIAFAWFLGALWAALRVREGEPGWLSLIAFGSGLAGLATLLNGGGWELALFRLEEGLDAETARLLFDQGNLTFANFWVALAGMLLPATVVIIKKDALPRWLGWYGLALAIVLLVARAFWASPSGLIFGPYVLFWIWLIAASVIPVDTPLPW